MKRLLPSSLFGRLVLILLLGLTLAQLLSAAISLNERDAALFHFTDLQWAQRDADAVALMESLGEQERHRIAAVLTTPRLHVTIRAQPWPVQSQEITDQSAAEFEAMLRGLLGPPYRVRVSVTRGSAGARAIPPAPAGVATAAPVDRRQHIITQVRLRDGAWAIFDHPRAQHIAAWPGPLLLRLGVLLASVIALALIAVRWVTRPLSSLASAAEALGHDIHRPPLPETGPIEVRRAARAFNTMQGRLRRYLEDRTRILSALSHDLKTPITRLRLRAELLENEALQAKFIQDLAEMDAMTRATLDCMRGLEVGEPPRCIDVMAMLESLLADAAELGAAVELQGSATRPYTGRPQALKRCLQNLLDNALAYGGEHPVVVIEDNEKLLRIIVRDAGPGIPQSELARVFEPFYRLEGSRNRNSGGSGLGLTIARNIAAAHGGSLQLVNRSGGGLDAILRLPRSQPLDRNETPIRTQPQDKSACACMSRPTTAAGSVPRQQEGNHADR
ncbi:MAG TPA: ATP-binding protein [Nitrococcus sp.]|nr:ATP-binding protein [Nitrococcus sp.]